MQATNWKLEEAIQLFYVGNEGGTALSSPYPPPLENDALVDQSSGYVKYLISLSQADGFIYLYLQCWLLFLTQWIKRRSR